MSSTTSESDTDSDERYGRLLRLACRAADVSSAAIVLVELDQPVVRASRAGGGAVPDWHALARRAIAEGPVWQQGEPSPALALRLTTVDGRTIGALCVAGDDAQASTSREDQRAALADVAAEVVAAVEAERVARELKHRVEAGASLMSEHSFLAEAEPRRALLLNAGIPIVLMLILGTLLGWQAMTVNAESRWLAEALEVRRRASRASIAIESMESAQRGYLITGDPDFVRRFRDTRARLPADLADLRERVREQPTQVAIVDRLSANLRDWGENAEREVAMHDRTDPSFQAYVRSGRGARLMDDVREDLNAFTTAQVHEIQRRYDALGELTLLAAVCGGIGLLLSILFFALFSLRQYRITRGYYLRNVALLVSQKEQLASQAGELQDRQRELERVHERLRRHAAEVEAEVERRTAALAESEERYRDLFENATDLILSVEPDGRFLYVNRALQETLGYDSDQLASRKLGDLFHPAARGRAEAFFASLLAGAPLDRLETAFQTADGREVRVDGRVSLRMVDGQPASVRAIFRDVTERYAAERMKDEFLSIVSHELRTPLTSIRGSLSLLASGVLDTSPERSKKMLEIAAASSERLVRLINDILDIERLSSGKATLERRDCELGELLANAAEALGAMAEKAGVALNVEPCAITLSIDPDRITQVLTNLIGNAVKFSSEGGTVTVRACVMDGEVRVEVEDEGRGVPLDKREAIFERFQQVDSSDSRQKGGTGLGLAISKAIVEQHGGRIWVEDGTRGGSRFCFLLPRVPAVVGAEAGQAPGDRQARGGSDSPTRVLVIENDLELANVLVENFARHGAEAHVAADGASALRLAFTLLPDLIVLDVGLPDFDGYDVVGPLRHHERLRNATLVVYSARELDEDQRARLTLGPTEFLTKGRIAPAEFERRIGRWLTGAPEPGVS